MLLLLLLATSCSYTVRRRDWSQYTGPGAEYFHKEELPFPHVDDPLEPMNRVTSIVNYVGQRYVFAPIAWFYRMFVPPPVRTHLALLGVNFQYPGRVINNLLQGKLSQAKEETQRFAVNTTIGVLGLFDPATKMGLHPHPEDFGQTFAKWGWKDSLYLYIPVVGPSSLRDAIGLVPDTYGDIAIIDWRVSVGREVNQRSDEIEPLLRLVESSFDPYEPARILWSLEREVQVSDFAWESDESAPTQTLETIFLKAQDPSFPERGRTERVRISKRQNLPYTLWLQPEPAPLVYVVSGLGGHRLGDTSLGLAELFFAGGNSVIAVSNPTNWEFIEHGSSVDLPGYAPVDALDLQRALTAIDRQVDASYPGRMQSRGLAGVSMGAFQALYIAANESKAREQGLLVFDLYLALNPPVNLRHAMLQLDRFYNAPLEIPEAERAQRIEDIFGKVLYLSNGELQPGMELPFTRLESEFLIGLAFRMDLQSTILQSQMRNDRGVLLTPRWTLRRAPAFREASEYSFMEYMYAFVLPYYSEHDATLSFDDAGAQRLFENCDLRSVAAGLVANDKVRLFANENDFLLRPEDLEWLRANLGERATIYPAGGHLGNLHRKAIQQAIQSTMAAVDDQAAAPSAP